MSILQRFMMFVKTQDTRAFIESMILCFAAPVIRNLKCASLLNLSRNGEDVPGAWHAAKAEISNDLDLDFAEISEAGNFLLLLVYRREHLAATLRAEETKVFLAELGYDVSCEEVEPYLARLAARFCQGVPHEIGIFLGYPLEDVRGFIENGGRNAKLSGYWKVYGDERRALAAFDAYRKAEIEGASSLLRKAAFAARAA